MNNVFTGDIVLCLNDLDAGEVLRAAKTKGLDIKTISVCVPNNIKISEALLKACKE